MKLIVMTDTHFGARNSSNVFRDYMKQWLEELFQYSIDNDITEWLHLGDFFDNRNHLGLQDIQFVCEYLGPKLVSNNINITVLVGNHDAHFRNTNKVTSLSLLQSVAPDNVNLIIDPVEVKYGNQKFTLLPWINQENAEEAAMLISTAKNSIIAGHLEVQGFHMYKNTPAMDHGLPQERFKEAKDVWSGHYHHKSRIGNIQYLGSTFHLTWNDYDDVRGFHVYDTETEEMEYVPNKEQLFIRETYDESKDYSIKDDTYKNKFVQLVVNTEGYNKVKLMEAMSYINEQTPLNLEVINKVDFVPKFNINENDEEQETDVNVKTTWEYIADSVSVYDSNIKTKIEDIYKKAVEEMYQGEE